MNDAGNNHSTRLPGSPLPDDGDLTPAQAIRRYGPPELVAEMDRLVEIETARLFPLPQPSLAGETQWDRQVTELFRQFPGAPEKVVAELNRRLSDPTPGEREWDLELTRVATKSPLSDCLTKLWQYLKAEGTAGRLLFTYQPTDPTAARVTIHTDRCRHLTVLSPGTLFEGSLALSIHCQLRTPAMPDTLRLDGHELWHVRVRPASEARPSAEPALDRKPFSRRGNVGGRPPKHDWTPFIQQLIRIAWLDGGNLTLTELRKKMKAWAEVNMPDAEERTIEKKLVELIPDDLLTD